jgi:FSR family fosmidomycin resistance protein-like MFS transporter
LLDDGTEFMPSNPNTKASHSATLAGAAWLGAAHLIVDAACVSAVLRASPPSDALVSSALAFVLGYDLLAFAGQAPLGWMADRLGLRRGAALTGLVCTAAALLVGHGSAVVLIAGVGNALFHVGAGAMVLAGSRGRAAPAGVFVAPGALGLGLGLLLGRKFLSVPLWPWLFAIAVACAMVLLVARKTPAKPPATNSAARPGFRRGEIAGIVALLAVSVAVRSLAGTVGCDACPRGFFLMVALPIAACTGKFTGGFLADRLGWIELSTMALLASAPLLAFSSGDLWLALPGQMIFQMTMPVTLAAMMRLMPARPAFGFGLLCVALVSGTLPAFLPGGWRPQGLSLFFLVLGSAAALYLALRLLRNPRPLPSVPSLASDPSTLCGDNS